MNSYTKVLSKFVTGKGLKLTLRVEVAPEGGISSQKVDETKTPLHELGLDPYLKIGTLSVGSKSALGYAYDLTGSS